MHLHLILFLLLAKMMLQLGIYLPRLYLSFLRKYLHKETLSSLQKLHIEDKSNGKVAVEVPK